MRTLLTYFGPPIGFLLSLILIVGCAPADSAADSAALTEHPLASEPGRPTTTLFLLRHAEKTEASADPILTTAGQQRAERLAAMLADADVSAIYSTDLQRTRLTVQPLATATGLVVQTYDYRALPALADSLLARPGVHVVVGHSNTTPALVAHLGGSATTPIAETEHDRLYVLTAQEGRVLSTTLLRY
ncbi:MAG: phosphoglycerate mutase family protein [Bacteroidota bacterium]